MIFMSLNHLRKIKIKRSNIILYRYIDLYIQTSEATGDWGPNIVSSLEIWKVYTRAYELLKKY